MKMSIEMDNETLDKYYEYILVNTTTWINPTNVTLALGCEDGLVTEYMSSVGIILAIPEWEAITTAVVLIFVIVGTIVGNILVILSVFTHKPLRIVQNFFIVSLAAADLAVAILVMPLNVIYSILGRWELGIHLCKMWLTCDILCCTSSILNLCAIALDRYWAITDPINYANKRTLRRVMILIVGVWILSMIISSPPLLGWNDWPDEFLPDTPCQLTSQQGYVIYSSLGSFYIPLIIMTLVYIKIFIATRKRLRERVKATGANLSVKKNSQCNIVVDSQNVEEHDSNNSESNPNENQSDNSSETKKKGKRKYVTTELFGNKNNFFVQVLLRSSGNNTKGETQSVLHSEPMESTSSGYGTTMCSSNTINPFKPFARTKSKTEKQILAKLDDKKGVVHQFIEEKQKISLSKERRAARTLGIIMGVFVVCWLPFFLMYVILPFCQTCCPSGKLVNFITWLGYINSTLNPLIYTIFNMDFRRAFKKLLGMKE